MFLVGVDEAGRGPLAGPVAVGVVKIPTDFDWNLIPGVGDSKQVNPKKRLAIFARANELMVGGMLDFAVVLAAATVVDQVGIVVAIKQAQAEALKMLQLAPATCQILLDGSLTAPPEFTQKTIIRGDASEPVIGLASILAKVTRDRYMEGISKLGEFASYDFATHKGYGTKAHRRVIAVYGLSTEHRTTYCQNVKLWGRI